MDLTNQQVVQALLAKHKIQPNQAFGQNFLVDRSVLDAILKIANLSEKNHNTTVLEIGPGIGTLTIELLKHARQVIAVEADHRMISLLQKITGQPSNLKIIPTTIQHFHRQNYLKDGRYKIVANIPYNISSYLLTDYLQNRPKPSEMIIMLQKEVAQRAVAEAGDSNRGLLSLIVELFSAQSKIIQIVPSEAFWPSPAVESAILRIIVDRDVRVGHVQPLLQIAKIAFNQRRKKIANSLPAEIVARLSTNKIDPNMRPQDLTLEQWKTISTLSLRQSVTLKI